MAEDDARQFPDRPRKETDRGDAGPAEMPVEPAPPNDSNVSADDQVEVVKRPRDDPS